MTGKSNGLKVGWCETEKVYRFRNWVAFERINMIKSLTRDDISNLTKERKIIGPELRFSKSSFGTRRTFYPFNPEQSSRGSRTWGSRT